MSKHYYEDGSPKKCRHCGHEAFDEVTKDFIDFGVPGGGPATEIQYNCASCKKDVGYWAYGYFDPRYSEQSEFRVWPDGTVQAVEDGEPYSHMSDDYMKVWAYTEDEAVNKANAREL